jgi:hypothetical protein
MLEAVRQSRCKANSAQQIAETRIAVQALKMWI